MEARRWLPLLTLNAAAMCAGLGVEVAAVVLAGLWVLDFGVRLARVTLVRAAGDVTLHSEE